LNIKIPSLTPSSIHFITDACINLVNNLIPHSGFTHYLKTAKEYKGELELLQENAEVYYLDNDNGVHKLETKENHALEKMKVICYCVCSSGKFTLLHCCMEIRVDFSLRCDSDEGRHI